MIGISRRGTELTLVLLAAVITGGAYTLVALGKNSTLPANIGPFLAVIMALLLTPHLANRVLARGADAVLLPLAAMLNGIGYVVIARLKPSLAAKQSGWTILGVAAYVITLLIVKNANDLMKYKWTFATAGVGMLLLPFLPVIGRTINSSRIWIHVGPFSFQPGEMAKVLLACFFAGYLVEQRELLAQATWKVGPLYLPEPRHFGPVLVAWFMAIGIMTLQKDLGSSLLFFTLFIVMVWIATERTSYLVVGWVMFAIGAYVAWTQFAHVRLRVNIWLDPWASSQKDGYQIIQGLYAMAGGGTTGTGLGLGDPARIPLAQNDFIFAAIGEELGLVGTTAILIAYLLIIGSGLRIAFRTNKPFEKLLAAGLTAIMGVQAFIIIAGVTRVLPLTGVALPFVSYGGSSLLANYILLALLMRISDSTAKRMGEVKPAAKKEAVPQVDLTQMIPLVDQ